MKKPPLKLVTESAAVPPARQDPAPGTVTWAFRELRAAADARSKRDDVPAVEAGRCAHLAWFAAVAAELLSAPDGCSLAGLATAQDLVAGAIWLSERHASIAEPRSQERAIFLRGIVVLLPRVGEEGNAGAICRLWSTLTANLIALCTSGKVPPKMQKPYLDELLAWSRETTWIAAFDIVAAREYAAWIDELVPTSEPCAKCGRQGTDAHPNGSHPQAGTVACFDHRDSLPPVARPDDCPHAVAAVVVATVPDGRVVLVQGPEAYCLPGGKREAGETAAQCARRELREEAGADVPERTLRFVGTAATHDGRPMAVYVCAVPSPPADEWDAPEGRCRLATRHDALACYKSDWLAAFLGVLALLDLAAGNAGASSATASAGGVAGPIQAGLPQSGVLGPGAPGEARPDPSAVTVDRPALPLCRQCGVLPVEAESATYCGIVCQMRGERAEGGE